MFGTFKKTAVIKKSCISTNELKPEIEKFCLLLLQEGKQYKNVRDLFTPKPEQCLLSLVQNPCKRFSLPIYLRYRPFRN